MPIFIRVWIIECTRPVATGYLYSTLSPIMPKTYRVEFNVTSFNLTMMDCKHSWQTKVLAGLRLLASGREASARHLLYSTIEIKETLTEALKRDFSNISL